MSHISIRFHRRSARGFITSKLEILRDLFLNSCLQVFFFSFDFISSAVPKTCNADEHYNSYAHQNC